MPTITVHRQDLEALITAPSGAAEPPTLEQVEAWLALVKGELKGHNPDTGELRIELQDSNRPDLWCCEGIARQIRIKRQGKPSVYAWANERPDGTIPHLDVMPGLETIRPYVAACIAVGHRITDDGLTQLIQTQEKLADIFGRKRRTVSIGLYRLPRITFPVTYGLVAPDEFRFTPLGMDTMMTPAEILMVHPKGLEYGNILAGQNRVPLLRDAKGLVLSFPPIINSRDVGEVQIGDSELFVEVTGTDIRMVVLTLNILAANLADRGAAVTPVAIHYPADTELGRICVTPMNFAEPRTISLAVIEAALGEPLGMEIISSALASYGYEVRANEESVTVQLPFYRNDFLHAVDVVEDVAISRGYGKFAPIMPSQFTVGNLSRLEHLADRVRDLMVGMEFQEIIANIMGSRADLCGRMKVEGTQWGRVVEVDNVMSQSYACLRQWVMPSLLQVEAASSRAFYPHRLFEVGEVAIPDEKADVGSRTVTVLGALIAHAQAHFSELHSCLDLLLYYLDCPYELRALDHPTFLNGRAGSIVSDGITVGLLGEIHPQVLEQWQIGMPAVALELDLQRLLKSL
jgi:phenylalanyl-tRNA synthetase beta chain